MSDSVTRIGFLAEVENAYTHRLASGISRFATPARGFITRDFILGKNARKLPQAYENWAPQAAVCYIGAEREELLSAIIADGRPMVNTSRGQPQPSRAVVLGDAEEVYDVILDHFSQLGRPHVVQYVLGESPSSFGTRERYRRYTEEYGLAFQSFTTEQEPAQVQGLEDTAQINGALSNWLVDLPKPVGIFSQQDGGGLYLCNACRLLGIKVPEEVAVVGVDPFDLAVGCKPPLTAISLPGQAIGFAAAQLVTEMLQGRPTPTEMLRIRGVQLIVRESTGGAQGRGRNVDGALEFILNHSCEGIKVNDVVSHTQSVSRMTFHKRFVETTGMTPAAAIQERKLSEARRLLSQTKLSIGTIAGMCGYVDELYFSQVFRKVEGVAPSVYRRMQLPG